MDATAATAKGTTAMRRLITASLAASALAIFATTSAAATGCADYAPPAGFTATCPADGSTLLSAHNNVAPGTPQPAWLIAR